MNKPYKFTVICDKTGNILLETNYEPSLHSLQTYESTSDKNIRVLKQTKTVYINMRYEAQLRLYNYITYIKNGLEIPKYKPSSHNSEIGKSIPILNF